MRYEWDLSDIYSTDDEYKRKQDEIRDLNYSFINKWKHRTDYMTDESALKEALDEYNYIFEQCGTDGDEGYYFWLLSQIRQNDPEIKARLNKIDEFSKQIHNEIQFFYLNICKIEDSLKERFLSYPPLTPYRHFLERAFRESPHILSDKEERIMNMKVNPSYYFWVQMTSNVLSRQEASLLDENKNKVKKPFSAMISLMNHTDKKIRDKAAAAFNRILCKCVDTAEVEINAILYNKMIDDRFRGFERPDTERHIQDDIETSVVDTLIDTVSSRFDIPHRYYKLKARLLGQRHLRYHERNVELGGLNRDFSFEDSLTLILKVFGRLDSDFSHFLNMYINEGRFDVFPRKDKVSGAFCAHHLRRHPTYILLNHNNRLDDVLTLAHELGHGINNELIKSRQIALNFGTPLSTAEVASTFMEDFVLKELLKDSDDNVRLALMMKKLNDDVSTIFRQVACYRFEQELHKEFRQSGYLSKKDIGLIFQKHMASYMGNGVEQSKGSENWWVYWSHIRSFFYVYSYASGLLISKSLQRSVKKDLSFIHLVKDFLSTGLSDSPRSTFQRLGVDINKKDFWINGIDEVEELLNQTEGLAKRLKKI
ncbi:MAG: M3 family oligoendopeptidase [Thermodesulfovibrionales bacterium]|nr:M3 family oligoendopeptidase [Thermodesulfovibrionales bacterium]